MAEIKHGTVTITVPDHLDPPERAGKMTPEEVQRLPKARRGIGLLGQHVADAVTKLGDSFILPAGVTVEGMLAACQRAEDADQVVTDVDVARARLQQANLLWDAEAWGQVLKVNDQVKAQSKHDPEIARAFAFLIEFMKSSPRKSNNNE